MRADRTPGFETSALPPSDPYERAADAYLAEPADRDVTGTAGDRIAHVLAQIFRRRDLRRTPAMREAVEALVAEVMGAPADRAPDARTVPYTYMLVREVQLVHTAPAYSGLAYPFLTAQILEGDYAGQRGTWNPWGRSAGSDTRATATALASWTFSSGSGHPAGASDPTGGRGCGSGAGDGFGLTLRAARLRGLPPPRTLWASGGPHPLARPRLTSPAMTHLPRWACGRGTPPPPPSPRRRRAPRPHRRRRGLALCAAPTTQAADKDPIPMPAPVPPSVAKASPAKPAIDLAVPKVVRTATFALG